MLPRNQKKKRKARRTPPNDSWPTREPLTHEDLEGFLGKLQSAFGWTEARPHQSEGIEAQLLGRSVLVHAGTGTGKTAIAAGPHVHEKSKGKVTIMVSPLIALQEEQVKTFEQEFKLTAIAVNSAHGGCTPEVMTKICAGTWQIVVISPEMLLSKRFISNVLRNAEMARRILSVVVDEAHVVSHWGSGFRKKYGSLGILRALLPKGTPIVAMSATLPPRVRRDVLNKLQFGKDDYVNINLGNDRPNVSIVIRAMQNNMNTYSDLDFLIPDNVTDPSQIPKAFVYADDTAVGVDIEDRIYMRLSQDLRELGLVRPYSAAFSAEYRAEVMNLFKNGVVRILVCTDAAGMGCNIPDVDIVVQWKLPSTVSSFVQRAGRAARASGRTGLAVLLVEKSTYDADLAKLNEASNETASGKGKVGKKPGRVRQSKTYTKASKDYAVLHGLKRGAFGGRPEDDVPSQQDVPIDFDAPDEGLYSLVQTGKCRRLVLTRIFGNQQPHPTVPCCDNCDPTLLERTRPGQAIVTERSTATIKRGEPNVNVKNALNKWRTSVLAHDFPDSLFGASGILKDETIDLLSSVGPIHSKKHLERVLAGRWLWFSTYGDSLWQDIKKLVIPPMQPKAKLSKGTKRTLGSSESVPEPSTRQQKRVRKEALPRVQGQAAQNPVFASPPTRSQVTGCSTPTSFSSTSRPLSIPTTPTMHPTPGYNPYMSYVHNPYLANQLYTYSPYYAAPNPANLTTPTPQHHPQIPTVQFEHYSPVPGPSRLHPRPPN